MNITPLKQATITFNNTEMESIKHLLQTKCHVKNKEWKHTATLRTFTLTEKYDYDNRDADSRSKLTKSVHFPIGNEKTETVWLKDIKTHLRKAGILNGQLYKFN